MAEYDKLWVAQSIGTAALNRARSAVDKLGYALPCVVQAVNEPFVTVAFDVNEPTLNGLQLVLPKVESPYFRAPTQVGDYGIALPVDAAIDHATAQSTNQGPLGRQGNLANLVFVPVAQKTNTPPNATQAFARGPGGAVLGTLDGKSTVNATGSQITLTVGSVSITIDSSGVTIAGGNLTVNEDATIKGIQYSTHVHGGVTAGGADTTGPQG